LREEAATNFASLRTEWEEIYRNKFQKYQKREEALMAQVKHAVARAEEFGKYQATEECATRLASVTTDLNNAQANVRALRRRLQEASQLGEKRRLKSEIQAQQARNKATRSAQQVEELRLQFRSAVQDMRLELHDEVKH
jgi:hypothetical protein